ncbi:Ala-tRNA(Pro) deacylase [Aureimonas pseudogalii]|uniref:Ala-tRNA(Pro) deacylase n=2 Tax=Aureimonas pseudogalii TaxID=1744844 RepID=A0A7W6H729_9HYPH|nr:Ala-tRNA(Pro) deacylase [Aureimonas pseudogalii]
MMDGDRDAPFSHPDAAMAALAPELAAFLDAAGLTTRTLAHEAVHTVEESRALRGRITGAHTKNLFLKDKKSRLFLVVAEEGTAVDLKTLHGRIGGQGRLSFAGPDQMRTHLGVEPGSVTAFGTLNDRDGAVRLVLDAALMASDIWNCHPLTNRATTSIARDDLMRFFAATGHEPLVAVLEATTADEPSNGSIR